MRALLLFILCLIASPVWAEQLRVSIIVPAGSIPIEFRLSDADSKDFWQRWGKLKRTEAMVPMAGRVSYAGLRVRGQEREVRLYEGLANNNSETRIDNLRMLERWVLSKAPPPYGPSLLAELDRAISAIPANKKETANNPAGINATLLRCNSRGANNQELRARCLEEALRDRLDWPSYANALEKALRGLEPP